MIVTEGGFHRREPDAPPMKFFLQLAITAGVGFYLLGKAMAAVVPSDVDAGLTGQQFVDESGHGLAGLAADQAREIDVGAF